MVARDQALMAVWKRSARFRHSAYKGRKQARNGGADFQLGHYPHQKIQWHGK